MPAKWRVCIVCAIVFASSWRHVIADVPRDQHRTDAFQAVLDRVHEIARDDGWTNIGWKDDKIEAWLQQAISAIAKGVDDRNVTLPVGFKDVSAATFEERIARPIVGRNTLPFLRNRLIVLGGDEKLFNVQNSIVLANGDVEITTGAADSIILCRGRVKAHTQRCVVVAGTLVDIESDGSPLDTKADGSVIISRGWTNVEHGYGSIIVGLSGVSLGHTRDAVLLNSLIAGPPALLAEFKNVKVAQLPLTEIPEHPLSSRIEILGVVNPARFANRISRLKNEPNGLVFQFDSRRCLAFMGQPITDDLGHEIEALKKVKLTYAGGSVAVFSDGAGDAIVPFEKR